MNTSAAAPPSTLAPMRIAVFRALWLASTASNFGWLIQGVGAAWLMTTIAGSADMVALVQTSITLPIMLFSLVAGAVADSLERRLVMLAAQLGMFTVSALLTVVTFAGLITPWVLLAFTFLLGCGVAFHNPAWQAAVGDVVPREQIGAAVLLNSTSFNLVRSLGPAVGGAVVASAGAVAAFAINTVSYLGLIGVLARWRPERPKRRLPRERLLDAVGAGLRYVAMSPNILRVVLRSFVFGASTVAMLALLPLVARDLIGGTALVFGLLLGTFGIGAVAGAFLSTPARSKLSNEALVRWSFAAMAAAALIIAVSRNGWLTGAALLLAGGAWVMALSLFNTTVQMSTPRWVVGRALSIYQMAVFGGMALGSWCWGHLAEAYSLPIALCGAALTMALGALLGLIQPLPARDTLNLDPLDRWQEPETALDIRPRSGPVAVSVEYDIDDGDVDRFLDLMGERHRIRRRDGAHYWTLMRDMQNPRLWTENFEMPTWVDYVRMHSRTTQADAPVGEALRALHRGSEPPRVRRMLVRNTESGRTRQLSPGPVDLES